MNNAQDKACCCTTSQTAATIDHLGEPVHSPVVKYVAGVAALIAAWLKPGKPSGFVQSARDVQLMVVIDGCQEGCAKAILENDQAVNLLC